MNIWSCLLILVGFIFFTFGLRSKFRIRRTVEPQENGKSKNNKQEASTDDKAKTENKYYGPIHIFFGSQGGTAADLAKTLSEEAAKHGFRPKVVDLIDFDPEKLKSTRLAVFLMATHGEGEPTDNAKAFNKWIIDPERDSNELKGVKFTVFGLGDKQYQFYNAQGKRTNEYLEKLGGERIYEYGEGDDNDSLEDDFDDWKEKIWKKLKKRVEAEPLTDTSQNGDGALDSNKPFVLKMTTDAEIDLDSYDINTDKRSYEFQVKQYMNSPNVEITLIKELRQKTDDGSTLHIEINSKAAGLKYTTAENLMLFPENTQDIVERAAKHLKLNLNDVFVLENNKNFDDSIKPKFPFPTPLSVKNYLTKFCDLRSLVKKKTLKDLAEFCSKKEDKEKLLLLSSSSGKVEYEAQIQGRMLGLIEVLEKFDVRIGLDTLIQIAPLIQPRYYTIASSSKMYPDSIHVCLAMQIDILPDQTKRLGLTSSFFESLASLPTNGKGFPRVRASLKESSFVTPKNPEFPVIMVGAGAGIAPFIGFVQEKDYEIQRKDEKNGFGEMTLYFGCRGRNWDYLYKEELLKYHEAKLLENYFVAFSREKDAKVYVQDVVDANRKLIIRDLFERNGTLYICGGLGMGLSVMKKLAEITSAHLKIDLKVATEKVDDMEKSKRIIKELWG